MKKIVLDTNILLVSISSKSKLHWIFKDLINGKYILCATSDVLSEYAKIIEKFMGYAASQNALGVLENLPNIEFSTSHYKFNLLQDQDDNKFVDCAISSNADFIVTHDSDFDILKTINFPKVTIINSSQFKEFLL